MTENAIAKEIVDAAFGIHTTLGPGLLESVYHAVLAYELAQGRLRTVSQHAIPVVYGTIRIDIGFRAGLIAALPVLSTGWKQSPTQSRKDARKTSEATGFGAFSV